MPYLFSEEHAIPFASPRDDVHFDDVGAVFRGNLEVARLGRILVNLRAWLQFRVGSYIDSGQYLVVGPV